MKATSKWQKSRKANTRYNENEKRRMLNEFKYEMEVYEKVEDTSNLLDMLVILEKNWKKGYGPILNPIPFNYIIGRIIKNLEDRRVEINCFGNTEDVRHYLRDMADSICKKYEGYIDEEKLPNYEHTNAYLSFHFESEPYNLVEMVRKYSNDKTAWYQEFLCSNMPIETRKQIFLEIANNMFLREPSKDIEYATNVNKENFVANYLHDKTNKKRNLKDLLRSINEDKDFKNEMIEYLNISIISKLHANKLVDFDYEGAINKLFECHYIFDENTEDLIISIFNGNYHKNDASYQEKVCEVLEVIDQIPYTSLGVNSLIKFLSEATFEVEPEILDSIMQYIVEVSNSYEANLEHRTNLPERAKLVNALIRKATNKTEYKQLLEYAKALLQITDIEAIQEREKIREQEKEMKRVELSTLLHNLNKKLQEEAPNKKLIKEIDFKKLS